MAAALGPVDVLPHMKFIYALFHHHPFLGILRTNIMTIFQFLAQLVRELHRYHSARSGFEKAQQAKISFCNSISWVSNCDDLLYIY